MSLVVVISNIVVVYYLQSIPWISSNWYVYSGAGRNSLGRVAKLKPAAEKYAEKNGYRLDLQNIKHLIIAQLKQFIIVLFADTQKWTEIREQSSYRLRGDELPRNLHLS